MSEFDEKLNALLSNPESMAQIMQLAKSFSAGQNEKTGPTENTAEKGDGAKETSPPPKASGASSLFSSIDPKLLSRLLPLVQELNSSQDSQARTLLFALRPYLKPERQEKVERALQLARLIHIGKKFISGWEG